MKSHIIFVPRENNLWADWLSKVGATGDADLTTLGVVVREDAAPPSGKPGALQGALGHSQLAVIGQRADKECLKCHEVLRSRGV